MVKDYHDIDTVDEAVDYRKFPLLEIKAPTLFIGFPVKNLFEQNTFEGTSNCLDFAHMYGTHGSLYNMYLKGMLVEHSALIDNIILKIEEKIIAKKIIDDLLIKNVYEEILEDHGLSAQDVYKYIYDGIYPVDITHLQYVTNEGYTYQDTLGYLFKENEHWYLYPELKILILTNNNTYYKV